MPSKIECRHGSRESLRIPALSSCVSSPFLRQFQLSGHTVLLRRNSSSLTVVVVNMKKKGCVSLLHNSTAGALASHGLLCPVAVCVHVHGLRERNDSDQALCTRDTFQVSCDALHVHLVALSGTVDLSCCFLHAVHGVSTLLGPVEQFSLRLSCTRLVFRSPARLATLSLVFS